MEKLRQAIMKALQGVNAPINAALEGLPPVEQFELNLELASGLRMLKMYGADVIATIDRISGRLFVDEAVVAAMAELAVENIEAAVKTGDIFRKSDHEAAVNAAVSGARETITQEVTARFERQIKAGEQRATLLKDVPTVLAEKISIDVLLADDAKESVDKFIARLAKCTEAGVTLENSPGFLAEVAALPLDKAGDDAFKAKVAPIEVSFQAARATSGGKPPVTNPAGGLGRETGTAKRVVI